MRICLLLERGSPPRTNPVISELVRVLSASGIGVKTMFPEERLIRLDTLRPTADLYLLKSDTELSLAIARAVSGMGAAVINSVASCLLVKNKILAAAVLARAGVRAPRSFAASDPARFSARVSGFPLIFKPYRGYHGAGLSIVRDAESLPEKERYQDVAFAQEFVGSARDDLKIFGIGENIFCVRKPFSARSYIEAGEPCPLPAGAGAIAEKCAAAFGLELFGIDLARDDSGFYVVDVNYFPGDRGVPEAARLLAEHIISRLKAIK